MNRDASIQKLQDAAKTWDIAVIGGGATGVGIAVDAASRGYSVCLFEQSDFGKGTSSRSTKLVHGGVRYLQQGNISLVMEALRERGILRQNAPHIVHDLEFVVPNYSWWEAPFYGIGMKVYDLLAFKYGFGGSRHLSRDEVLQRIPTLSQEGLRGGVLYHDAQFDDARLLVALVQTATEQGATMVNYVRVVGMSHDADGFIEGIVVRDEESGVEHQIAARAFVNATGAFSDAVRTMDDPSARPMIAPSQGVHLVLDQSFLPGQSAIMVPRTSDGRVMFAIPWRGHALIGTTDTPITSPSLEPVAMETEIDFILETAGQYLSRRPERKDVLSVFAGIRPLVKTAEFAKTAALSREHTIHVAKSGLITIAGGKWTTYRKMAEDCVDHATTIGQLEEHPCVTQQLKIHGHFPDADALGDWRLYGSDAAEIQKLMADNPALAERLHPSLPIFAAMVVWAVRHEMARTVDDVLARRIRALFLNARAAIEMAPKVAQLLAVELGRDAAWEAQQVEEFDQIAKGYVCE
jgi:glycerol-3-phosphate dehydrogenase